MGYQDGPMMPASVESGGHEAPSVVAGFTTALDMTAEDILHKNPRSTLQALVPWRVPAHLCEDTAVPSG